MRRVGGDRIVLTPEAVAAWQAMTMRVAVALKEQGVPCSDIGTEEFWLEDDGLLEIRASAGKLSVKMKVPPEHWHWRQNN